MHKQDGLSHTKRWLLYTVIIGSLPFVIRLTVILLSKGHNWELLWHPIDFVFMGLTVNISNINETNHKKKNREMTVFWSVILIIMLSITIGSLALFRNCSRNHFRRTSSFIYINSIMHCVLDL